MRLLSENPEISTREIADEVGVSNGKAYYCVTALIEKGLVKVQNFSKSEKKAAYLYQLTPRGIREKALLTATFLERKRQEFEDLKAEIARLEGYPGEDFFWWHIETMLTQRAGRRCATGAVLRAAGPFHQLRKAAVVRQPGDSGVVHLPLVNEGATGVHDDQTVVDGQRITCHTLAITHSILGVERCCSN